VPEKHSNIAATTIAASTDLLHRRIPLPYSFRFVLGEFAVCIETDSALMREALLSLEMTADPVSGEANAEWEIAVETQEEARTAYRTEPGTSPFEVYRFGPSSAVRTDSGSWFAHTPPSLDGVGFAMVTGNERDQVNQLAVYLQTILILLEQSGEKSIPSFALEVSA
jgi:hypothetical protein